MLHHRVQLASPLHHSSQLTETLAAHLREGVAVFDRDLRLVLWNPCLERVTGLAAREVMGKRVFDLFPSSQGQEIARNLQRVLTGKTFSSTAMIARTGVQGRLGQNHDASLFDESDLVWTMLAYAPWRCDDGAMAGVIVIANLAGHAHSKRQLNDNWDRSQAVIDHLLDGMAVITSEGLIESFNRTAERMFGYRAEEVIGQNLATLILEPLSCHQDCYLRHFPLTGEQHSGVAYPEALGLRKDGSTFPLELVVSKIELRGGHMFTAQLRDISKSKAAEAELRMLADRLQQLAANQESVREAERARIARELHDELGGLLAAARFDVNRLGQLPGIYLERVGQLRESLDAAICSTRAIISELHPPALDQLGLWGAIEWYAEEMARRCALNCQVLICPDLEDVKLRHDVGIALFRIVQEALNNIVKHASAHAIIVRARRLDGALIEVEIIDDGKGITRQDLCKTGHWGVHGMHERLRSLGGELVLESAPGCGTTLRVSLRVS